MLELGPARSAWGGTGGKVGKRDCRWRIEDVRGRQCASAARAMANTMSPLRKNKRSAVVREEGKEVREKFAIGRVEVAGICAVHLPRARAAPEGEDEV